MVGHQAKPLYVKSSLQCPLTALTEFKLSLERSLCNPIKWQSPNHSSLLFQATPAALFLKTSLLEAHSIRPYHIAHYFLLQPSSTALLLSSFMEDFGTWLITIFSTNIPNIVFGHLCNYANDPYNNLTLQFLGLLFSNDCPWATSAMVMSKMLSSSDT